MSNNYTYPIILDYSEDSFINIIFPTFNNQMTSVERNGNFIEAAQDWLTLNIIELEETSGELPEQNYYCEYDLSNNQKLLYINVWMPYHRSKVKEVYTKKTLTIPVWLDELSKDNNINFSATLVEALKNKLKLD